MTLAGLAGRWSAGRWFLVEDENLAGTRAEAEAADKLRAALLEVEAPDDQLARLGMR